LARDRTCDYLIDHSTVQFADRNKRVGNRLRNITVIVDQARCLTARQYSRNAGTARGDATATAANASASICR
jgi:hypothetical protein